MLFSSPFQLNFWASQTTFHHLPRLVAEHYLEEPIMHQELLGSETKLEIIWCVCVCVQCCYLVLLDFFMPNTWISRILCFCLFVCFQGDHISMNQQVDNFAVTVQQLRRFFRRDVNALGAYLSKCIFYCGLGSNDYLNNYFMRDYYSTSSQYTPKAYADSLIQDYSRQLTVQKKTHSDSWISLWNSIDHVFVFW